MVKLDLFKHFFVYFIFYINFFKLTVINIFYSSYIQFFCLIIEINKKNKYKTTIIINFYFFKKNKEILISYIIDKLWRIQLRKNFKYY